MKVDMILALEWTTYKSLKKKLKNSGVTGNRILLTFVTTGRNAQSIGADQANWKAGHCEFVIYPMVDMRWIEIHEMNHILNCG